MTLQCEIFSVEAFFDVATFSCDVMTLQCEIFSVEAFSNVLTLSCDVKTLQCEIFSVEAFYDVMKFSCDVKTLLLKLCSAVITLYFDVTTLAFSTAVLCGVATLSFSMSWQCRDIGIYSLNLGCFDMML